MFNSDNYTHPVPGVMYIKESILGPGGDADAFYSWFETICSCLGQSCIIGCVCIEKFGRNYTNGKLITEKLANESCIYECSAFCSCDELCSNRVVQKGPNPHLQVRAAGIKGLGLFCLQPLEAGTFVAEYAGELISKEVAEVRYRTNPRNKYILILREHYSGNIVENCYDAFTYGNVARYINHSCLPNCVVLPVRTGCIVPKAAIFTSSYVAEDEEITYSYFQGSSILSNSKCFCYSANCKGYLPSTIDMQ